MSSKTFLIQSEGLGKGDDQLGIMLMANFLRLLAESKDKPATLIFWNNGILCKIFHISKNLMDKWLSYLHNT